MRKCEDCGKLFLNLKFPDYSHCLDCDEAYWADTDAQDLAEYEADRRADFNADMAQLEGEMDLPFGSLGRDRGR